MAKRLTLTDGGVEDLFAQWAAGDGMARGQRIAAAMNATAPVGETGALSRSHRAEVDVHPNRRSVVHIGSELEYSLPVAVATGYMARALDSGGG